MSTDFPQTLRVGIFVFEDFEPIDVWGPIEAFAIARFIGTGYPTPPPHPFSIQFVSNETRGPDSAAAPKPVRAYNGPRVVPDMFRDDTLSAGLDVLLIPGGQGMLELLDNAGPERDALLDWVRTIDTKVALMTSVCTGSALLACSGVLDGIRATTNHQAFAWVTSFGPKVRWDNVSRWVDAGHYVTSAGVSAGTDMAFHLVSRLCGRAVAEAAVLAAEYHWQRDPQAPIPYPQQAKVPSSGA